MLQIDNNKSINSSLFLIISIQAEYLEEIFRNACISTEHTDTKMFCSDKQENRSRYISGSIVYSKLGIITAKYIQKYYR